MRGLIKKLLLILISINIPCVSATMIDNSPSSDYLFCNIFMTSACFGIASGDEVEISMPVDFFLYKVRLSQGVFIQVYEGYNPKPIVDQDISAQQECASTKFKTCVLDIMKDGKYIVEYKHDNRSTEVQIAFQGITEGNKNKIKDFLGNFRSCIRIDDSVTCSQEKIFTNFKF